MGVDFISLSLTSLLAGVVTTILRLLNEKGRFQPLFDRVEKSRALAQILEQLGIRIPKEEESYQERLSKLFAKFEEITEESDEIVSELERHVRSKEILVEQLHQREQDLASRIDRLKKSPEFVAARNQQLLEQIAILQEELRASNVKEGRRSAIRDFVLFALGVTLPYILGWLAPKIGLTLPPLP